MSIVAVLDATAGDAERQARALGAFLREGLTGGMPGETVVFYDDERDRERLVGLAPTRDVRLIRMSEWWPARVVDRLVAVARAAQTRLFVLAGGAVGAEVAVRLASRSGGAVLTDALTVDVGQDRLVGRRNVYSAHLVGRFELSALPWCVSLDASWSDAAGTACEEHRVLAVTEDDHDGLSTAPFEDVERVELSSVDELAQSRFVVAAGRGAGSRQGVERIATAAKRMGADFAVSRPVAMNAWAPMDRLIGISGSRAAPRLCIVAGASGAPAFYWGIERAAVIAAIDLDARAPVMRQADVVVVGDAVAVIEELADIVAAERGDD